MKQHKIIRAYKATEELDKIEFSVDEQWQIYNLRKNLRPHVEFQQEREKAINEKYTQYADENSTITGQHYVDYIKEQQELNNMDVEYNYEPVVLKLKKGINFKTIEALEDFVEFKNDGFPPKPLAESSLEQGVPA